MFLQSCSQSRELSRSVTGSHKQDGKKTAQKITAVMRYFYRLYHPKLLNDTLTRGMHNHIFHRCVLTYKERSLLLQALFMVLPLGK